MMEESVRRAAALWAFKPETVRMLPAHEGGRNAVFSVWEAYVLRLGSFRDRTEEDYLAETEYIRFLARNGAPVADVLPSKNGRLAETVRTDGGVYSASLFERAEGDQLADHDYEYIDGVPQEELWFNTGKTLGRIHALSKVYRPKVKRFDFFDKYNETYFERLIPDRLVCPQLGEAPVGRAVKDKLHRLLDRLRALPAGAEAYGMLHFDFSDGNYNIDYTSGKITVYDFDNCRTGWYLFDLANLWTHGVGWIARNGDAEKRKLFMERYFEAVLAGYRSETPLSPAAQDRLSLLVDAVRMENIIDEFETVLFEEGTLSCDGEQAFRLKGLLEDIPFMGFFDKNYDAASPFSLDG